MNGSGEAIRTVSVFGATGSIGDSTVSLLQKDCCNYKVRVLTANNNYKKLAGLVELLNPEYVVIANEERYKDLKKILSHKSVNILAGASGMEEAATLEVDIAICGIVGIAALLSTLLLAKSAKVLGLANKESLVCAGKFLLDECVEYNCKLIPLDSEHNSIYRIFDFTSVDSVKEVIITASGGPFLYSRPEDLINVTPAQAVSHPSWDMGDKISVDSATLMNKALEVIETYRLFPLQREQISVLIHPQSIFHAFVKYIDGAVKALISKPDMRISISLALGYPGKIAVDMDTDLLSLNNIVLERVDHVRFRAISLAYNAIEQDGTYPIVLSSSNEVFVSAFLQKKIGFTEIVPFVEEVLENFNHSAIDSVEHVFAIDEEARSKALELAS